LKRQRRHERADVVNCRKIDSCPEDRAPGFTFGGKRFHMNMEIGVSVIGQSTIITSSKMPPCSRFTGVRQPSRSGATVTDVSVPRSQIRHGSRICPASAKTFIAAFAQADNIEMAIWDLGYAGRACSGALAKHAAGLREGGSWGGLMGRASPG